MEYQACMGLQARVRLLFCLCVGLRGKADDNFVRPKTLTKNGLNKNTKLFEVIYFIFAYSDKTYCFCITCCFNLFFVGKF